MNLRLALVVCAGLVMGSSTLLQAAEEGSPKISFKRTQLDNVFRSEGAAVGDFNHPFSTSPRSSIR
jgi:hypothetical protein